MHPDLATELSDALGGRVTQMRAVGGGDTHPAWQLTFADASQCFVKTGPDPAPLQDEVQGLAWLRAAAAAAVPAVTAHGVLPSGTAYLALPWIDRGRPNRQDDVRFGRQLAALHRAGAEGWGLARDNHIGPLPQDNRPTDRWLDFYRERRLLPQLSLAAAAGKLPKHTERGIEACCARLTCLLPSDIPCARLHGDLWGGNRLCDRQGHSWLIDPAVYGGDREIDLAMMRLFGGFSDAVFAAYHEAYPLSAGHADRVALYQLYPLLVHLNLFGSAYLPALQDALLRLDCTSPFTKGACTDDL